MCVQNFWETLIMCIQRVHDSLFGYPAIREICHQEPRWIWAYPLNPMVHHFPIKMVTDLRDTQWHLHILTKIHLRIAYGNKKIPSTHAYLTFLSLLVFLPINPTVFWWSPLTATILEFIDSSFPIPQKSVDEIRSKYRVHLMLLLLLLLDSCLKTINGIITGIPLIMGIMGYESLLLMDINGIYHPEPPKKTINCALFAFWVGFIRTCFSAAHFFCLVWEMSASCFLKNTTANPITLITRTFSVAEC